MALETSRRKRDFTSTASLRAWEGPVAAGGSFAIQKHAARRLHYDFRLEAGRRAEKLGRARRQA
jgi:bifunctional non-homologous end joining protein LigD